MPTATDSESPVAPEAPADATESESFYEGILEDIEEPSENVHPPASSPEAPSGDTPTPPADPAAPAPTSDPAAPAGQTPGTPPAAGADGRTPYTLNADRQAWDLGGAYLDPEQNLVIPAAARATVERLMRSGIAHQGSFRKTLEEARTKAYDEGLAAAAEQHPDVIAARQVLAEVEALTQGGPDAWAEFLGSLDQRTAEWKVKQAEAVLQHARTPRTAPAAPATPEPVRLTSEEATGYLQEQLPALLQQDPALSVLTGDTLADVVQDIARRAPEFFYVVEEDRPEDDLYRGDVVCDFDRVLQALKPVAAIVSKSIAARTAAEQAKQANAAKLKAAGVTPTPPATPPASREDPDAVVYPPKTPEQMARFLALPLDERNRLIQGA